MTVRRWILVLTAVATAGCSGGDDAADAPDRDDAGDKVRAAIASPEGLERFNTGLLPGEGRILCVDRQQISLYLFDSEAERAETAALIDPADPSHVGNGIVSWSGNPVFWEVGPALVLYVGPDDELFEELVDGLGEPYAAGRGRTAGNTTC